MHPDLERVIHLQQIEDAAERARRTIADEPARQQQLAAALEAARQALENERGRLSANQAARREIEKELAMQQTRLSKFRDQLMEVKTNREYQAMQKEIETAQAEVRKLEDRLLEQMIEFDEVTLHVKQAEQAYRERMAAWQIEFLEDEIKRGQYPETIALLDRKLALEPQRPDLLYARAEAKRLRGQDNDVEQALADLVAASALPNAPAQAHRSLGLLLRERKDNAGAAAALTRYLEAAPDAPDAGLIKTYLSELQP